MSHSRRSRPKPPDHLPAPTVLSTAIFTLSADEAREILSRTYPPARHGLTLAATLPGHLPDWQNYRFWISPAPTGQTKRGQLRR